MLLALLLATIFIVGEQNPFSGLVVSIAVTLVVQVLIFFVSPAVMDLVQRWLYGTRWVDLVTLQRYSPEAAETIARVCRDRKLKEPRLGIIEDQNPTAFTYGSLPNTARVVVSQGLFTYLDDEEIAAVYAHELGHVVQWDFAVMTLASTLVQVMYLLYVSIREIKIGGDSVKNALQSVSLAAFVFYTVGTYLQLYLSRTREYYADHFAAEITGNPNALSRSLVKIAYGIVTEQQEQIRREEQPSRLMEGTRALGIYDARGAASSGTAYQIADDPSKIGRVFLWDLFNPWGWWMELRSTHPLTGKRIRALSTYAEQLGLDSEFDFATVVREGKQLSKRKLYSNFALDLVLFNLDWLGFVLGLFAGMLVLVFAAADFLGVVALVLFCFGAATLLKTFFMYPDFKRAPMTDVLALMSDPYASPLRGRAVKLDGEVIGRGDPGNRISPDLKFQDETGTISTQYMSRFGRLGNFLVGVAQTELLIGQSARVTGWFRRGVMPWIDLILLESEEEPIARVRSYHRFWKLVLGAGCILLSFALRALLA